MTIKLIANCLDFFGKVAQVNLFTLSPNIFFIFPTLFHYLVNKAKDYVNQGPSIQNEMGDNQVQKSNEGKIMRFCLYITHPSSNSEEEGSISITLNISKLIEGKTRISCKR